MFILMIIIDLLSLKKIIEINQLNILFFLILSFVFVIERFLYFVMLQDFVRLIIRVNIIMLFFVIQGSFWKDYNMRKSILFVWVNLKIIFFILIGLFVGVNWFLLFDIRISFFFGYKVGSVVLLIMLYLFL